MADFYKSGGLATDSLTGVIVLHAVPNTDANYVGLWKQGVNPVDGNQYQIPASKGLDVLAFKVNCASAGMIAISCGYADARVISGINGTGTAPIGGVTSVWGDTTAGTAPAMGGFSGYCDASRNDWRGTEGAMQVAIPKLWPVAAGTKYPFIRMRGITVAMPVYIWVREVS